MRLELPPDFFGRFFRSLDNLVKTYKLFHPVKKGPNLVLIKLIESRNEIESKRPTVPKNRELISDISFGKEKMPIPVINSVDDCPAPVNLFKENY